MLQQFIAIVKISLTNLIQYCFVKFYGDNQFWLFKINQNYWIRQEHFCIVAVGRILKIIQPD